jgi:hypothetical protein
MIHANQTDLKEEARRIVDELPAGATWDDLMERIYVRQAIETGMEAAAADRVVDVAEVRKLFGLPE